MPKNTKRFKNRKNKTKVGSSRPLLLKEEDQEYARATKMLGDMRVECECYDGRIRIGVIRGKMRKRAWVNLNDVVLLTLRDFQDNKADIIHVYNSNEVKQLVKKGQLPNDTIVDEEDAFVFDDSDKEEVKVDEI